MRIPLVVILGPTASGKTALSLALARSLHGEIISCDSRQIYKEIDIGSDKIPLDAQRCHDGIPHHMIDLVAPDEIYTMSEFKRDAELRIAEIHARGHLPMLVGGTGLYIRAIVENFELPDVAPDIDLREKYTKILEENSREKGVQLLHDMLTQKDPIAAARIHANNIPYVIRALEIAESPQKSPLKIATKNPANSPYDVYMIGIDWPRETLYERIDKRVDEQMTRGLVEESQRLIEKYGVNSKLPSLTSLGLKEFTKHFLNPEEVTLADVAAIIKKNTRHYAKRQQTWFKKDKNIHWINGEDFERQPEKIIEELICDILAAITQPHVSPRKTMDRKE